MNCELIFYLSNKTSLCEKTLKSLISKLDLKVQSSYFATTPKSLGKLVINALEENNAVFIIGGLGTADSNGIENVFSKALANKKPDDLKKIKNPLSSDDGYLVRQGGQLIVVLPDEPEQISAMLNGLLNKYLKEFTNF